MKGIAIRKSVLNNGVVDLSTVVNLLSKSPSVDIVLWLCFLENGSFGRDCQQHVMLFVEII